MALLGAANVDEAEFPSAGELVWDREANRHLAFGGGIHRCLGSHLARLELRVALREWHRRIPDYRIKPGVELNYTAGHPHARPLPDGARLSADERSDASSTADARAPSAPGLGDRRPAARGGRGRRRRAGVDRRRRRSFLDGDAHAGDQVRMLGVQASLLAAGSLDPDVVRQLAPATGAGPPLPRRRGPPSPGRQRGRAARRRCARSSTSGSRRSRRRRRGIPRARPAPQHDRRAPPAFGTIDARRLLAAAERADGTPSAAAPARRRRGRRTVADARRARRRGRRRRRPRQPAVEPGRRRRTARPAARAGC